MRNCPQYHSYTKDVVEVRTFVLATSSRGGGGGVLRISCDGDDRRIFGFEIFDSGIFLGGKIWQVSFGWLDLSGHFFGYSKQSEDLW